MTKDECIKALFTNVLTHLEDYAHDPGVYAAHWVESKQPIERGICEAIRNTSPLNQYVNASVCIPEASLEPLASNVARLLTQLTGRLAMLLQGFSAVTRDYEIARTQEEQRRARRQARRSPCRCDVCVRTRTENSLRGEPPQGATP